MLGRFACSIQLPLSIGLHCGRSALLHLLFYSVPISIFTVQGGGTFNIGTAAYIASFIVFLSSSLPFQMVNSVGSVI